MPFVPFNNTIKAELIFTWQGQRVENVHYFLVDETPNEATAISLAEGLKDWWQVYGKFYSTTEVSLVLIRSTIMETENSPGIEYAVGLPIAGTEAGASLPNNVTIAVKWTTGYRGRSYRGRTYHIGLPESAVTGNTLAANWVTNMLVAYGELMSIPVDVGPAIKAIASSYHNNVLRTVGVVTPVIGVQVDNTVDSQRRRLPGRGR